jgi:thiol-disulfide isomerase/thioredoxin
MMSSYATTSVSYVLSSAVFLSAAAVAGAWVLRRSNNNNNHAVERVFPILNSIGSSDSIMSSDNTVASLTKDELMARFPSLQEYLQCGAAPIVGLYFCAGWCDDCQMATPAIRRIIQSDANEDRTVYIVYVSSDYTQQKMEAFQPSCFGCIPFDNVEERGALKRHFRACAKKELASLGMTMQQRKHGTPTLILLDSSSGRVLTEKGVDHCLQQNSSAEQVIEGWKSMLGDSSASDNSFDMMSMDDILLNCSKRDVRGN